MMEHLNVFKFSIISVLSLVLLSGCGGPMNGVIRSLEIDANLHVLPAGKSYLREPETGSYYTYFTGAQIVGIDHFIKAPGMGRTRQLYLETYRDHSLERTVKTVRLIDATFGAVDSVRQCYYLQTARGGNSSVIIAASYDETNNEAALKLPGRPDQLPELTSFSLVRGFDTRAPHKIVTTNYEANGRIGSYSLDNGTAGNFQLQPKALLELKPYGMPLSLVNWLRSKNARLPLGPASWPETGDFFIRHYGYDEIIEVDVLRSGAIASTTFLHPSVNEEERILNPLCTAKFKDQLAQGASTVF